MTNGDFHAVWNNCPTCGQFGLMPHRCDPIFTVRLEWDEIEDAEQVRASDPEEAAQKFAEEYDAEMEYVLCGDNHESRTTEVIVTDPDGRGFRVSITSEPTIIYRAFGAEEIMEPTTDDPEKK